MTDGEKEKIKLRANFINALAIGIVLIGAFTPITRAAYDPTFTRASLVFMVLLAVVCFAIGFVLHSAASRHLDELDR